MMVGTKESLDWFETFLESKKVETSGVKDNAFTILLRCSYFYFFTIPS